MTVEIIDHNHYKCEDGQVYETSSRPTGPAPDGRYDSPEFAWHDIKAAWVPVAEIDAPGKVEM